MKALSLILALISPMAAYAHQSFSIPTADGITSLNGQIDYPANNSAKAPLVVMLPGTGLFDRDVYFGNSGTDRDFLFKDLAQKLNARGYATLRFDLRGVSCNQKTAPACPQCKTAQERAQNYLQQCFNFKVRKSVTPENIRSDIEQVYSFGAQDPQIDASKILVFAHSEGTIHIAHSIADGKLNPSGLVMMGLCAESPRSLLHWQSTERHLSWIKTDAEGLVGIDQLKAVAKRLGVGGDEYLQYLQNASPDGVKLKEALANNKGISFDVLKAIFEELYQSQREALLQSPDDAPWPSAALVQASSRWWKMFFTDDIAPAELLKNFRGRISMNNGSEDMQTPPAREVAVLGSLFSSYAVKPRISIYPGQGHSLGDAPLYGPMSEGSQQTLLNNFDWALGRSN